MSRARKKESCTCIYRCFSSKTPGCIPCLSLGSACPTPLKRLNWRLSLSSPVTPQSWEVRCSKKHNTLTQLKLEPRTLDLEFEWSPQKPQGHIISQLPSPLHKETVELGTTEDLRTIISLERFLLQDKRNNNKTNNNGAFLTKALNKGSNLVEPLYSHSDRLSIWNSICNNETKTMFALTCQIQH